MIFWLVVAFILGVCVGAIGICHWALGELDDLRREMRPRCHHVGMISAGFCQNCGAWVRGVGDET